MLIYILGDKMDMTSESTSMEELKKRMMYYKSKITDKYNRAYSHSKRITIARELLEL